LRMVGRAGTLLILLLPPPSLIVPLRQGPPVRESSHAGRQANLQPMAGYRSLPAILLYSVHLVLSARARARTRDGQGQVRLR
jgi:hypothetical protein